jgi:IrrE N-terminal-like domain
MTNLPEMEDGRKAVDELIAGALAYRTGAELKALFDFIQRFPHLAPYNAMLLHVQNPNIRYALRATVWARYGRRVRDGARPYVILQIMGPVAFVFDLGDTYRMPGTLIPDIPEEILDPFAAKGQPPPGCLDRVLVACALVDVITAINAIHDPKLAGRVTRAASGQTFLIELNARHTDAQKIGTLSHELAHIFCGHLGATEKGFWPNRRGVELSPRELEAEAVAYLVTSRMRLDIGSIRYLAEYLTSEAELPNYSLDIVLKAAGKIEQMAAGTFRPKKKSQK